MTEVLSLSVFTPGTGNDASNDSNMLDCAVCGLVTLTYNMSSKSDAMHNIICVGQAGLKAAKVYKIVGGITRMLGFPLPGAANMAWVAEAEKKAWTPVPCDCGSESS